MNRICVIDVAGLSPRLLDRAGDLWIRGLACPPWPMRPTLPALAASVQASMTTGVDASVHGIIADGIYRRDAHAISFVERSNTLLNKKRFWQSRRLGVLPKVAMVFWSQPLAGAADFVLGALMRLASEGEIADQPLGLYAQVAQAVGPFDPAWMWGPQASTRAGEWIARASAEVWRLSQANLQWVYLPGLDFALVRHGPSSSQVDQALAEVDRQAQRLAEDVVRQGGQAIIVSDGGYVQVSRCARPNALLRQEGLLALKETPAGMKVDLEKSAAFAMVDQQVAHVFCVDADAGSRAAGVLLADPAIDQVLPRRQVFPTGAGYYRSGELVALAATDAWLDGRWGADEGGALSGVASGVALGQARYDGCGYDPGWLEGSALSTVRASRGVVPADPADYGVLAATCPLDCPRQLSVLDVPSILRLLLPS